MSGHKYVVNFIASMFSCAERCLIVAINHRVRRLRGVVGKSVSPSTETNTEIRICMEMDRRVLCFLHFWVWEMEMNSRPTRDSLLVKSSSSSLEHTAQLGSFWKSFGLDVTEEYNQRFLFFFPLHTLKRNFSLFRAKTSSTTLINSSPLLSFLHLVPGSPTTQTQDS